MASVFAGRGQWEDAIRLQRHAGEDDTQRERLAYMLFQAGRYRDAHELYAQLARATGAVEAEINDGVALAMLGDDEAAVASYRRALDAEPQRPRALVYMANALLRLGRREEAVDAYEAFLSLGFKGEASERVRRILLQIAPDAVAPAASPLVPPPPTRQDRRENGGPQS
jgi:tetratricopeptide (TPR) repeat protein